MIFAKTAGFCDKWASRAWLQHLEAQSASWTAAAAFRCRMCRSAAPAMPFDQRCHSLRKSTWFYGQCAWSIRNTPGNTWPCLRLGGQRKNTGCNLHWRQAAGGQHVANEARGLLQMRHVTYPRSEERSQGSQYERVADHACFQTGLGAHVSRLRFAGRGQHVEGERTGAQAHVGPDCSRCFCTFPSPRPFLYFPSHTQSMRRCR